MKMRKHKIIISIVLICSLLTAAFTMVATSADAPASTDAIVGVGSYSSSEEVVYALLKGDGSVENAWVVGTLNVEAAGNVTAFGEFTEVKNLTSTRTIDYSGEQLNVNADAGRFYWQGELSQKELPWNVALTYKLDGKAVSSAELAGSDGSFELLIETSQNTSFDKAFFENYMLQVTVTLDTAMCKSIVADGATAANAGSNKTLAFTVMPGADGLIGLSADVSCFELDSITFAAVPFSMALELGDLSGYTGDFAKLADAISELNTGVQELRDGSAALSDGAALLASGSKDFNSGLSQVTAGGTQLKSGSAAIIAALGGLDGADMSSLAQLPAALRQMAVGLDELGATLTAISSGYSQAYGALGSAIAAIPEASVSEADIYVLMAANQENATIAALVENYQAAQTVKGTYAAVSEAFTGVSAALPAMSTGISEISGGLTAMATQIEVGFSGSGAGLGDMAAQYMQFHTGLVAYIDGVSALAGGYSQLNNGITELSIGTSELYGGVDGLADGVRELDDETSQLPDKIDEMADEMLSEYTSGDFEPVSFLSDKNENVELVQFVFRTNAIELPKAPAAPATVVEKSTFWTRLLDLFR